MKTVGDFIFWATPALSGIRQVVEVWNSGGNPQYLVKIPGIDGKCFPVSISDCRDLTEEETAKVSEGLSDKEDRKKVTVAEYLAKKGERENN